MRIQTIVAAACVACVPSVAGCSSSSDVPTNSVSIEGNWYGYVPRLIGGQDARVTLVAEDRADGTFVGTLEVRQMPVIGAPVRGRIGQNGEVEGTVENVGTFSGVLEDALLLTVDVGAALPTATLWRDDPDFARFDVPRLGDDGEPLREYEYQPPVARGDGLAVGDLRDHGMRVEPIESLVEAILAGDFPRADGLLIIKDGALVVEEYFYGHDDSTLHCAQSVTKSVLALLVGQAIADGHIEGTSVLVHEEFADYAGTQWIDSPYRVTVHHALSMAAGLDWDETGSYLNPDNDAVVASGMEDPLPFIFDRGSDAAPGNVFEYNSGLSMMLGALLVRSTGASVEAYAERRLFRPLGIENFYWRPLGSVTSTTANADTGGGLFLTGRDFAKLGLMVLRGGRWDGVAVIEPEWAELLVGAETPALEYGYHWWRLEYELGGQMLPVGYASGFGGQRIWVVPAFDLVVVQTALDFEGLGADPERQVEEYVVPALL